MDLVRPPTLLMIVVLIGLVLLITGGFWARARERPTIAVRDRPDEMLLAELYRQALLGFGLPALDVETVEGTKDLLDALTYGNASLAVQPLDDWRAAAGLEFDFDTESAWSELEESGEGLGIIFLPYSDAFGNPTPAIGNPTWEGLDPAARAIIEAVTAKLTGPDFRDLLDDERVAQGDFDAVAVNWLQDVGLLSP